MAISIRPALRGGVAAASAVVVVLAAAVTPVPDASGPPDVSHAAVELQAAALPLAPGRALTVISSLSPAQVLDIGQALSSAAVTPTIAPSPPLINLANFIDWAYLAIEPWVEYGVDVAAYVAAWIIPYVGWIVINQVDVVYNFVESLVHSGVFNFTDWLRGQGSAAKNIADWIVDAGLALVWLGIDEIGAWVPLPPLPFYPPRPPYADVPEGLFGDVLVSASSALAQVANDIWNIWEPVKGVIGSGVGSISGILDAIAWVPFVPLINFELNTGWTLIASEGDAITGFAHDLINAGDQFVVDAVHGGGLIPATVTALQTTLTSIGTRGGQAVGALVDWGRAQLDYLVDLVTPGAAIASTLQQATATAEPTSVAVDDIRHAEVAANRHRPHPKRGSEQSSTESPTANRQGADDNDEPTKTDKKRGADARKPAHKQSADADGTTKKPRPKDDAE